MLRFFFFLISSKERSEAQASERKRERVRVNNTHQTHKTVPLVSAINIFQCLHREIWIDTKCDGIDRMQIIDTMK